MTDVMDMRLANRARVFSEVIAGAICTDFFQKTIALESALQQVFEQLESLKARKRSLYIVGNGGSAAVASHAMVDFVNVAKINAQVLHEPSVATCMANDYGYENVYARVLSGIISSEDLLIAISSSGNSKNILNAVQAAKLNGAPVVTLSGFFDKNPLRAMGDLNFWLDSKDYGYVEVGHQFILHNLSDRFFYKNTQSQVSECSQNGLVDA